MEQELSTEIDLVIGILRSNPGKKFDFASLHSLSGIPMHYLKQWVPILEKQGHVKVSYNIATEEFYWVGKSAGKVELHLQSGGSLSGMLPIPLSKKYTNEEISALVEKIKAKQAIISKMRQRQELLKKKKAADSATSSIMEIKLENMTKELAALLRQAKRISASAAKS